MSKSIEHNGQKFQIPNTWEEFINSMTMKNIDFKSIKRDEFNKNSILIKLIDSHFQELYKSKDFILPELKTLGNQSISIFSDYGGEHTTSKYYSYSFLFCGWDHSWYAREEFEKIRIKHSLNKKEISFKDLNYGPINRALEDYLMAINKNVFGFLLTVLVEKEINPLFLGNTNKHLLKEIEDAGLGHWKIKNAEKLMRILHIISYILPLISDSDQKIFWMTDEDSIVANKEMFKNTYKLLQNVLKIYTDNKYDLIYGAIPFKTEDVYTMDLLSITDLVAGSVEQYFTSKKTDGHPNIKEGAEKVIKWLGTHSDFLKKETVLIYQENNMIKIDGIKFNINNQ
ncbi:hypothetical protein [Flavobacterium undicola]|uniref:hypothetical protein n=1 Tax=Flavobacterium undicola TaxID=1932779 RepID=UPI0013769A95|nr:hypothetical protein [Flavobacterium undicola]MBA0882882.1 hypothetical protein [Flavobacterium undicola]